MSGQAEKGREKQTRWYNQKAEKNNNNKLIRQTTGPKISLILETKNFF